VQLVLLVKSLNVILLGLLQVGQSPSLRPVDDFCVQLVWIFLLLDGANDRAIEVPFFRRRRHRGYIIKLHESVRIKWNWT
jgi:hypothetical protein